MISMLACALTLLSLGEIESRMTAQGITIREVELLIDRRSGEILSNKPDR